MSALRSSAALLVTTGLLVGIGAGAEWLARGQVEAVVRGVVQAELRQASDDGQGFDRVDVDVQGWALVGLLTGRLDGVRVRAEDGVVRGIPVDSLDLLARGVADGGREVESLSATLRADGAGAVARTLAASGTAGDTSDDPGSDPLGEAMAEAEGDGGPGPDEALADAIAASSLPLPPDRFRVQAPFPLPLLGTVPVELEVLVREADGGLVVEPVRAAAAGIELDLAQVDLPGGFGLPAADLPAGLRVQQVQVVDDAGRAVVVADLGCPAGCTLR